MDHKVSGRRVFPYAQESAIESDRGLSMPAEKADILSTYIRDNLITAKHIQTPYGLRKTIYADYTASGRSLSFIEKYLQSEVIPMYANTHTLASHTGKQTTLFRQESRNIIKRCVHGSKDDVVFFTGNGATGAVILLSHILQLKNKIKESKSPVVLVGPYEHHSSLLPWKETGAEVIQIAEKSNGQGGVDLGDLEEKLIAFKDRHFVLGSFSACSNITGILCDTVSITSLLHKYNAFAFFDYASAAPYVDIDMNPRTANDDPRQYEKDAIAISTHKFVGGPQTPGILVIKKRFLSNSVPSKPGGGTVFFVTEKSHRYLENFEEREEGGTPNIIGDIRAGLVFQLKEAIGIEYIQKKRK